MTTAPFGRKIASHMLECFGDKGRRASGSINAAQAPLSDFSSNRFDTRSWLYTACIASLSQVSSFSLGDNVATPLFVVNTGDPLRRA